MAIYSIYPAGFPDQESTALEAIFTIASARMRDDWRWALTESADVYMVRVDSPEQWSRYQARYPSERMLAFRPLHVSVDARWQIRYLPGQVPSLRELIQLLDAVGDELAADVAAAHAAESTAADDPPSVRSVPPETAMAPPPAQDPLSAAPPSPAPPEPHRPIVTGVPGMCYDPAHHLLGLIRQAQADGVPRRLVDETSGAALFLDAGQNHFFAPAEVAAWHPLLPATKAQILVQPMDIRQLEGEAAAAGCTMRALDHLIFLAALMGSRGRLWIGASLDAPVRLKRWPSLRSVPNYSDYVGLVAFMNGNTADLKTIAERTSVPLGQVIDFHNSCMALDLLEIRDATVLQEKPVDPALRSLFGKIAQHLRDGGQDNKSENLGETKHAGHRPPSA